MGTLIAVAVVGILVGVASGMLGIGGGTLMVPTFRLIFGMDPLASTATSLFAVIPTSISGAVTRIREHTCLPALGIALGLGGACTSPLGVWLSELSPGWMVMTAAALVIAYSAITMFSKAIKMPRANAQKVASAQVNDVNKAPDSRGSVQASDNAIEAAHSTESTRATYSNPVGTHADAMPKPTRKQIIQGVMIGMVAGILSGYVGVGGGFLMVPLMISVMGLSMKMASGTSLVAIILVATPGVIRHAMIGNVDFLAGIAIVLGSIPGAYLGAKLSKRVPERTLRLLFGCFLIFAAILLVVNELGLIG